MAVYAQRRGNIRDSPVPFTSAASPGQNARRMARLTCHMRAAESGRGKALPEKRFLEYRNEVTLHLGRPWQSAPPGSKRRVAGASAPNGAPAGSPTSRSASRRTGEELWLVQVHLLGYSTQGVFEIGLFSGGFGCQAFEVSGSLTLQRGAVVQPTGHFHRFVHCLPDAFGSARSYHLVKVSITARTDCSGQFLALWHVSYFMR